MTAAHTPKTMSEDALENTDEVRQLMQDLDRRLGTPEA